MLVPKYTNLIIIDLEPRNENGNKIGETFKLFTTLHVVLSLSLVTFSVSHISSFWLVFVKY